MLTFVLKVVSRCNLDCSYCYVYNKGDSSWQTRPAVMSDAVYSAALDRIRRYCERTRQRKVKITFHGGEPCLAGWQRFARWCAAARERLKPDVQLELGIQTNGTLLDENWARVLRDNEVLVGLSLDGPKEVNDLYRVDHMGRGSYNYAIHGLRILQRAGVTVHGLAVMQLGADGLGVHRHLVELGLKHINYLLPCFTHDTVEPIRKRYGSTPCADFFLPILEYWWSYQSLDVRIALFWQATRLILGSKSGIDIFGNRPLNFLFIEADGAIEGLDVLRVCKDGMARTASHVPTNDFWDKEALTDLHRKITFDGLPLPDKCRGCSEQSTCAGGYLPHRHSREQGFNNPTIWCADMLKLFSRLRELLNVTVEETSVRRKILEEMSWRPSFPVFDK